MNADRSADEQSDSRTVAQQSEEASPAAPQPESPRLGIIHLLAWTACVAAYYGARRWLALLHGLEPTGTLRLSPSFFEALLWETCDATALGGLILLAARRMRGLRFPRYPGETWFVILGLTVVIEGARYHVAAFMQITYPTIVAYMLPWDALVLLLFLVATIRTKSLRWRLCFGSYLAASALVLTTQATEFSLFGNALEILRVPAVLMAGIGSLCLVVAAVKDFVDRYRTGYPWTHWMGVVLALLKLAWVVRGLVFERLVRWLVSVCT
jgi:hypothetical protein